MDRVTGFVLYQASVLIADGSELLLCVPSFKKIVGTVVLPVLGAVRRVLGTPALLGTPAYMHGQRVVGLCLRLAPS